MYWANKSTGVIQPALHLNNPSLTDIMVEANISAFGKTLYCDNDMVRLHVAIHNSYRYITRANVDYGPGLYQVTILAGNITSVPFEVKINDDNILESNKTFILTLLMYFHYTWLCCINYTVPYQATYSD